MYNVNVRNSFGSSTSHAPGIAISAYGEKQQYLGCSIIGYQDSLLTETGTQFYSGCLIQVRAVSSSPFPIQPC